MTNFLSKLALACAACVVALPAPAWAQAGYPNRPVKIIVAFPPGQATDQTARAIAMRLSETQGQQFFVENRPGAASIIGSEAAAKAPNDGYTLFMGSSGSLAVNPSMYSKLPYDPIKDFTPISMALKVPFFVVVRPDFPANSIRELVAYLKANPNKVNLGTAGAGAANHLASEYFKSTAGVSMVHVPYKGSPPAVTDLLGGQIGLMFETGPLVMPHVKSGKLKALAVGSAQRAAAAPDLVTIAESGYPGFESVGWAGLLAPTGTPREIIVKINAEVVRILAQQELKDRFVGMGAELVSSTPEEFGAYIRSESAKWSKVIKDAGIKVD
ncbi:MAG: tripartite tricarboxylate transporter substrate binding protein [Betaproteobacteria bacterium]|nr:tripartite tricarboxylate transporter substrate binding protein [Betaproteobacteria bacterium]